MTTTAQLDYQARPPAGPAHHPLLLIVAIAVFQCAVVTWIVLFRQVYLPRWLNRGSELPSLTKLANWLAWTLTDGFGWLLLCTLILGPWAAIFLAPRRHGPLTMRAQRSLSLLLFLATLAFSCFILYALYLSTIPYIDSVSGPAPRPPSP
jgi:hypothetical protein